MGSFSGFTYSEFYEYISKAKKSNGESYLKYLYGVNDPSEFQVQGQIEGALTENFVSTSKKYSIITGIDNNLIDIGPLNDEWLKVYLIPSDEISQTKCKNFITKA